MIASADVAEVDGTIGRIDVITLVVTNDAELVEWLLIQPVYRLLITRHYDLHLGWFCKQFGMKKGTVKGVEDKEQNKNDQGSL